MSRNAFPAPFFGTDFSTESAAFSGTIPTSKIQRATRTENAPRGAAFCATKIDAPTRRTRPLSAPPNRAHIGADSVRRKRVVLAAPRRCVSDAGGAPKSHRKSIRNGYARMPLRGPEIRPETPLAQARLTHRKAGAVRCDFFVFLIFSIIYIMRQVQ
jgi:hypothetical protein